MDPDTAAELATLRAAIETLRREVQELNRTIIPQSSPRPEEHRRFVVCHGLDVLRDDGSGKVAIRLRSDKHGARATFHEPGGRGSAALQFDEKGMPSLRFYGADDELRVWLGVDHESHGFVCAHRSGGGQAAILRAATSGGAVAILGPDGKSRVGLLVTKAGHGEVTTFAASGKTMAKLTHAEDDIGGACVLFRDGTGPGAVLSTHEEGGRLTLLPPEASGGIILGMHADGPLLSLDGPAKTGSIRLVASTAGSILSMARGDRSPGVEIQSHSAGSSLTLHNSRGEEGVDLHALPTGGAVIVLDPKKRATGQLSIEGGAATLQLDHGTGTALNRVHLGVNSTIGLVDLQFHGQSRGGLLTKGSETHLFMSNGEETPSTTQLGVGEGGGRLSIHGPGEVSHVDLGSTDTGGCLILSNELGIPRVRSAVLADGGGISLLWGGTNAVIAQAAANGGTIVVNDARGEVLDTLPGPDANPDQLHGEAAGE